MTATRAKEYPVIMSADEVRPTLDGLKTMFRRVVKWPDPHADHDFDFPYTTVVDGIPTWSYYDFGGLKLEREIPCPFGQPGDRLWVRETWAVGNIYDGIAPSEICKDIRRDLAPDKAPCGVRYPANNDTVGLKWRPSSHMPRWASRLKLEVTERRVERLNDISIDDMEREGIRDGEDGFDSGEMQFWERYAEIWDSTNAKKGHPFDSNPWVWAVTYRMIEQ